MTQASKISKLKEFKNEKEFREFLIDFLRKRGFTDVIHTHRYGSPELGKDIIAKFRHGIDGFEYYAFVVKYGHIGGGTNEIETIKNQIKQSFEYPYVGIDGNKIKINKVKVVTNDNFTNGAQNSISTSPELRIYNNFGFWWNETLIPEIDEFYIDFWLPGDSFSKEYSKEFTRKLQEEIEIRDLTIQKIDDKKLQKLLDIFIEPRLTISYIDEDKITKEKKQKEKKVTINSFDDLKENLILSGEQGSGKSKILNNIACHLGNADKISENKKIPIRLKAPKIKEYDFNIDNIIIDEVKFLTGDLFNVDIFNNYKKVLFIDDTDLLKNTDKELLVKVVSKYCEREDTHYMITYRKNEFDIDSKINSIRIHNFNNKQIEQFITKFFEGTERGNRFIQILRESDILSKLPTTPLTITLISLLFDENNYEIPATLSDIYTDFSNILFGKLSITNKTELLLMNLKRRLFSSLALEMLDNKKFEISFDEFANHINDFLDDRGYQTQSEEELLQIIDNSGLLYIDDNKYVGFKQQAFIEFLASVEIYHVKRDTHYQKLIENFNDITWQNTAIFYAGHSKELVSMIDDIINNAPNKNIRDYFVNSGGMGYLAQALYQTSPKDRSKLVSKSLDNLIKSYHIIRQSSKEENNPFYKISLPLLATILSYWFSENFKSITLIKTLKLTFSKNLLNEDSFENEFKLLMIASTLMNPYIGDEEGFEILIERKGFMNNPILPLVADMIIEMGNINKKDLPQDIKKELIKKIKQRREFIQKVIKEPAYRFNEKFEFE